MASKKVRLTFIDDRVIDFTTNTFQCSADRVAMERQFHVSIAEAEASEEKVLFYLFRAGQRVNDDLKAMDFEALVSQLAEWEFVDDEDNSRPPTEAATA